MTIYKSIEDKYRIVKEESFSGLIRYKVECKPRGFFNHFFYGWNFLYEAFSSEVEAQQEIKHRIISQDKYFLETTLKRRTVL